MSSAVTISVSADPVEGVSWHLYRDALDEADWVRLDLRGLAEARLETSTGRAPTLSVALPTAGWWALVRSAAEARARGADGPLGPSGGREAARVLEPSWAAMASDRPAAAARLAHHHAEIVGVLRRAVEQSIADGADPLAAACTEALLATGPIPVAPDHPIAREATERGERVAVALRRAWPEDEARAWRWLLEGRSPVLSGRSPLEALQDADWEAVLTLLGQIETGTPP